MVRIRGKFRHFPLPREKILPAGRKRCCLEKAIIIKNILTSFRPRASMANYSYSPALLTAFDGPSRAEVRTGPAVGAKGWIDPGAVFPLGNGPEGTGREAVPAIRAFFGDLVRHRKAAISFQRSAFSRQQPGKGGKIFSLIADRFFRSSSTYPRRCKLFPSGRPCPWHPAPRSSGRPSRQGIRRRSRAGSGRP